MLSTIFCGALLSRVLRLVLCGQRRDEFLGDLAEEAHLRLPRASRAQLSLWLWSQVLSSLPSLASARAARLAAAAVALAERSVGGERSIPARPALAGSRGTARGLSVPLAVSLSLHGLLVLAAGTWLLSRVDEVDPARAARAFLGAMPDLVVADVEDPREQRRLDEPSPARRLRLPRRRMEPSPAPAPTVLTSPTSTALTHSTTDGASATFASTVPSLATEAIDDGDPEDRPPTSGPSLSGGGRASLPPRVAEKRCLSCPPPRLPRPQSWMATGRDALVKTCVSARGGVTSVESLRTLGGGIDAEVADAVRRWRFIPYRVDGRPVPFCYVTRFLFTTH